MKWFDDDEEQNETWDDEDLDKEPENVQENMNDEDTESEEEVPERCNGETNNMEVNAPATDSSALDDIEKAAVLKMNYCREAEDEPDNDSRSTGDRTRHYHLVPPVRRDIHLQTMRCRMNKC